MVNIDELISDRIESLATVFELDKLAWYRQALEHYHLSVDDGIGYLHRRAWSDVQHNELKDVRTYLIQYAERFGLTTQ